MNSYKELKKATKVIKKIRKIIGDEVVEEISIHLKAKVIYIHYHNDVMFPFGPAFLIKRADENISTHQLDKSAIVTFIKFMGFTIGNIYYKDEIAERNFFRKIEVL